MKKIQSRDVRDALMEHAPEMITRLVNIASGFDVNEDGTRGEYNEQPDPDLLFSIIKEILPAISIDDDLVEQKEKAIGKAKTIAELQKYHADGIISYRQLNQYIQVLRANTEIVELKELINKIEELDEFQIN